MTLFPETPRVVFEKNPLVEVIAQLRFPPILAISADQPAAFQERIRGNYPFYQKTTSQILIPATLTPLISALPLPFNTDTLVHQFITEDSNRVMALSSEFIAVTDKRYVNWTDFLQELIMAEAATREIYQPPFYSRVGLRYQDVVDRQALGLGDRSWRDLLNPAFAGLFGADDIDESIQEVRSECLLRIADPSASFVRIKYGLLPAAGNEIAPFGIDSDFFVEGRITHDTAIVALEAFHRIAGNLFRWAIRDDLRRALVPSAHLPPQ